jgi:pimeloyl-[acyl-carrier protein] methyl ester esterase
MLRLYGRLDGLVPIKVAQDLQQVVPHSEQYIFTESSHAPFMTELDTFCQQLITFARS